MDLYDALLYAFCHGCLQIAYCHGLLLSLGHNGWLGLMLYVLLQDVIAVCLITCMDDVELSWMNELVSLLMLGLVLCFEFVM